MDDECGRLICCLMHVDRKKRRRESGARQFGSVESMSCRASRRWKSVEITGCEQPVRRACRAALAGRPGDQATGRIIERRK
jgi:hypothetical protein